MQRIVDNVNQSPLRVPPRASVAPSPPRPSVHTPYLLFAEVRENWSRESEGLGSAPPFTGRAPSRPRPVLSKSNSRSTGGAFNAGRKTDITDISTCQCSHWTWTHKSTRVRELGFIALWECSACPLQPDVSGHPTPQHPLFSRLLFLAERCMLRPCESSQSTPRPLHVRKKFV